MALDEELIDGLYVDLVVSGNTVASLDKIARMLGGHAASIVLERSSNDLQTLATLNMDTETILAYHSDLSHQDYLYNVIVASPDRPMFCGGAVADLEAVQKTDYFEYVLKPSDMLDAICMRFHTARGLIGVSVFRSPKQTFDRADLAQAEELYPHLQRALMLHESQQRKILPAERAARAFDLTLREKEILEALLTGFSYRETEAMFRISKNTLKWHLKNIFHKCGATGLAEMLLRVYSC